MVSISIIAIVLISIYRLHLQTISTGTTAKFYAIAPLLAQKKLASIELVSVADASDTSGAFGDEFPGFTWSVVVRDVDSEVLGNVTKDLKKIDISISYEDDLTYRLRTYRFAP